MCKPINFRPSAIDSALINALLESKDFKNNSDLIRRAIFELAKNTLSKDVYLNILATAYEREVKGND